MVIEVLRIVSGKWKHLLINEVDRNNTRPTTDRNREMLFNVIGQYFDGGMALDLFAGSGALGIEAMSRGIESCTFVDNDMTACKTIDNNLKKLNVSSNNKKVVKSDGIEFLKNTNSSYDLILADPPYRMEIWNEIVEIVFKRNLLNQEGILVIELPISGSIEERHGSLELIKTKDVGISKFVFYRHKEV
ncbi:MAG TPA: 16S rRNA (guanine(966)-N(2))-methyltransferase RsmD [Bacillota bacterium]|nr:16S rRNA (guanine(966)-N(2))-methyltransferase RsmD [Bacillota bacterium]